MRLVRFSPAFCYLSNIGSGQAENITAELRRFLIDTSDAFMSQKFFLPMAYPYP